MQILSFRGLVAIFDRVPVGFNVCLNSALLVSVADAKMALKRRLMAMSLVSVIMFVRNIVCWQWLVCLSRRLVQAS